MLRLYTPARARFAAFCWGVGALSCSDLGSRRELSAGLGGQSGDGSGFNGGQTGDGGGFATFGKVQCPHKSTVWEGELDEVVPELGITPEEVIASVETGAEEALRWVANERLKLGAGQTEVLVDLHYAGGEVRLRESTPEEGVAARQEVVDPAPPAVYVSRAAQYCGTALEIDIEARLATTDGALDEKFSVKVTANMQGSAHFEGWLPEQLDGALADSLAKQDTRLYVASIVTPWGSSGEVMAIPINQPKAELPGVAEQVAVWPVFDPAVCADPGYGALLTTAAPTKAGGSLSSMFEALAPRGEISLTWNVTPAWPEACSETTTSSAPCNTTLQIALGQAPQTWCVAVTPFDEGFTAYGRVDLELNTADELWSGRYTSAATLSVAPEGSTSVGLAITQQGVVASGEALGFPQLDLVTDSVVGLNADLLKDAFGTYGYMSVVAESPSVSAGGEETPAEPTSELLIRADVGPKPE